MNESRDRPSEYKDFFYCRVRSTGSMGPDSLYTYTNLGEYLCRCSVDFVKVTEILAKRKNKQAFAGGNVMFSCGRRLIFKGFKNNSETCSGIKGVQLSPNTVTRREV